jgi:hypothetical protein
VFEVVLEERELDRLADLLLLRVHASDVLVADLGFLKPNTSVALHRHSHSVVDVLPPESDSTVQLMAEKPKVSYKDIGGMDSQKQEVREAIELPLLQHHLKHKVETENQRVKDENQAIKEENQAIKEENQAIKEEIQSIKEENKELRVRPNSSNSIEINTKEIDSRIEKVETEYQTVKYENQANKEEEQEEND